MKFAPEIVTWCAESPYAASAATTPVSVVLSATESLTVTGELSDAERGQLIDRFGEQQTVELVLTIAFYSCVSRVLGGLGVPSDERGEKAPGLA